MWHNNTVSTKHESATPCHKPLNAIYSVLSCEERDVGVILIADSLSRCDHGFLLVNMTRSRRQTGNKDINLASLLPLELYEFLRSPQNHDSTTATPDTCLIIKHQWDVFAIIRL